MGSYTMRPISRGFGSKEFTLRVACELGPQFVFEAGQSPPSFAQGGIEYEFAQNQALLVVTATGIGCEDDARRCFFSLQSSLTQTAIKRKLPISVPKAVSLARLSSIEIQEESLLRSPSWPRITLRPYEVNSIGAWIYPEHECVILREIFRVHPVFSGKLQDFVGTLRSAGSCTTTRAVDQVLLLASDSYTLAACSTQWVQSFMIAVSALDMLATRGPRRQSIVTLVQKYCAPSIAICPRPDLFSDPADCDVKISAVYKLRSQYTHEGHVPLGLTGLPNFSEARDLALKTLEHILLEKFAGR